MKQIKKENSFDYSELSKDIIQSIDSSSDWLPSFFEEEGVAFFNIHSRQFEKQYNPLKHLVFNKNKTESLESTSLKELIMLKHNKKSLNYIKNKTGQLTYFEKVILDIAYNKKFSLSRVKTLFSKINGLQFNVMFTEGESIIELYNIAFKLLFSSIDKITQPEKSDIEFIKKTINLIINHTIYCLIQSRLSTETKFLIKNNLVKKDRGSISFCYPLDYRDKESLKRRKGFRYCNPFYDGEKNSLQLNETFVSSFIDKKLNQNVFFDYFSIDYKTFIKDELQDILCQFDFYKDLNNYQKLILLYSLLNNQYNTYDLNIKYYSEETKFFEESYSIICSYFKKELLKNDSFNQELFGDREKELFQEIVLLELLKPNQNNNYNNNDLYNHFLLKEKHSVYLDINNSSVKKILFNSIRDEESLKDRLSLFKDVLFLTEEDKSLLSFFVKENEKLSYIKDKVNFNYNNIENILSLLTVKKES